MTILRILSLLIVSIVLGALGCSNVKEQCQAVALASAEADNAFQTMLKTAERGKRGEFEKSRREFEAAIRKLSDVEVTGDSMLAVALRKEQEEVAAIATKVAPAFEKFLEAIEKDPEAQIDYPRDTANMMSILSTLRKFKCD